MQVSLYSHPESVLYSQEPCDEAFEEIGFEIIEECQGVTGTRNTRLSLLRMLMTLESLHPRVVLTKYRRRTRTNITSDSCEPLGLFLCRNHRHFEVPCPSRRGKIIKIIEWDMEDQARQSVALYEELVGKPDNRPSNLVITPSRDAMVKGGVAAPVTTGPRLKS